MIDVLTKKFQKKNTMSTAQAGMVGMITGAAIGTAATIFLKDEKNRKKLHETIATVKDQAKSAFDSFKSTAEEGTKKITMPKDNQKDKTIYS